MKYFGLYHGQEIVFSDWKSAQKAADELGLTFFLPREDVFSGENQENVVVLENGEWKTKLLSEVQCVYNKI